MVERWVDRGGTEDKEGGGEEASRGWLYVDRAARHGGQDTTPPPPPPPPPDPVKGRGFSLSLSLRLPTSVATSLSAFGRRVASLSPRGGEGNLSFPEKDASLLPSYSTRRREFVSSPSSSSFSFYDSADVAHRRKARCPEDEGRGREKANGIFNRCLAFSPRFSSRFSSRFSHFSQIFPCVVRSTKLVISTRMKDHIRIHEDSCS